MICIIFVINPNHYPNLPMQACLGMLLHEVGDSDFLAKWLASHHSRLPWT